MSLNEENENSSNNPFCINYTLELLKFKSTIDFSKEEKESSELIKEKDYNESFYVEKQKKVSIYDYKEDHKHIFSFNNKFTIHLYVFIIKNIKENEDFIKMSFDLVKKQIKISRKSYYECIKELKESSYIHNKCQGYFWINPAFIFKGNRITFFENNYPKNIKVVHTVLNTYHK